MWGFLLLFGVVASKPAEEFRDVVQEGEFLRNDGNLLMHIVPGYNIGGSKTFQLSYLFPKDNEYYTAFNTYIEKGVTAKGLTFNVYDDDLRNAAIALFRFIRDTWTNDRSNFEKLKKWANDNVNSSMLDYALRLASLYGTSKSDEKFLPPFIEKPNYFINGETIMKALYVSESVGKISEEVLKNYDVLNIDKNTIAINTNYSAWNLPFETRDKLINYFTEDIALNSYYYGLHLLHPFWMSNEELNKVNPRHAEHYYFAQQQLYSRYLLEKDNIDATDEKLKEQLDFIPYLYYENGLHFPTRSVVFPDEVKDELAYLRTKDIAIKECIQRAIVKVENGTLMHMNEDNYIELLSKLVRSNIDSIKAAKLVRSTFGNNGYPIDKYNPAPSTIHHPQTTLRDPAFWNLLKKGLDYFSEYINDTEPYDVSKFETSELVVTNAEYSRVSTTFEYYLVNLYKSLVGDKAPDNVHMPDVFARQRRLNHGPITLNFTVESKKQKDVVIRLFLGPQCSSKDCWNIHFRFFQLDCYSHRLNEGSNIVTWTPETSSRYSSDQIYNQTKAYENIDNNYDLYKFPKNLVIPKGREDGLNFTIFIMILDDEQRIKSSSDSTLYTDAINIIDNKQPGFPFHMRAKNFNENASNYRFYNMTVFHIRKSPDNTGYFTPYLY